MKVLILTYYFPPNNATAGFRPLSWAKEFVKNGIEPVVVTRHWKPEDNTQTAYRSYNFNGAIETKKEGYSTFALPYIPSKKRNIGENIFKKSPFFRKVYYLILTILGHLDIDLDGRHAFKNFVSGYLKNNKVDLIIVTCPPFNLLRLAFELKKQFSIPFVADFRDLWNNNELNSNFRYSTKDYFFYKILKQQISKWLKNSLFVTTSTIEYGNKLREIGYKGEIHNIFNGFNNYLYQDPPLGITPKKFDQFTISCVGTLYPQLDLDIFINGFNSFIKENSDKQIQLRFIGAANDPAIANYLCQNIHTKNLYISHRVSHNEAIAEAKGANILFFPSFINYKGLIATKIFDYMASQNNILIAPGDYSTYDAFLLETNAGLSAYSPNQVHILLNEWYQQWLTIGSLLYKGKMERIKFYSREYQATLMINYIKERLD